MATVYVIISDGVTIDNIQHPIGAEVAILDSHPFLSFLLNGGFIRSKGIPMTPGDWEPENGRLFNPDIEKKEDVSENVDLANDANASEDKSGLGVEPMFINTSNDDDSKDRPTRVRKPKV
jgi:hypothetical protein